MTPLDPIPPEDEARLRALFASKAPTNIDVANGWRAVMPQLHMTTSPTGQKDKSMATMVQRSPRIGIRQRIALISAILLVPAVLLGGNFAGNRYFWGGSFGDSGVAIVGALHLYTDVNQQQQQNGVTIKVTKVYADAGRTLIAYELTPSQDLIQRYHDLFIGSFDIFYQADGDANGSYIQCMAFPRDGSAQDCLLTLTPAKTTAKTVSVTWVVRKLYLNKAQGHDELPGTWSFQFTVPFHTNNLGGIGAGGPIAQP